MDRQERDQEVQQPTTGVVAAETHTAMVSRPGWEGLPSDCMTSSHHRENEGEQPAEQSAWRGTAPGALLGSENLGSWPFLASGVSTIKLISSSA